MADNFDPDAFLAANGEPTAAEGQAPSSTSLEQPAPSTVPVDEMQMQNFDPDKFLAEQNIQQFDTQQQKYGSPGQIAATVAEGGAQGFLGPFAAPLEHNLLGVPYEDIKGRAEASPWWHGGAETGALIGGLATGTGVGGLAGAAGEAIAPKAVGTLAKIGSAAVKGAIENGIMASSDEMAKEIYSNPEATSGTALLSAGLTGFLGGAAVGGVISGGLGSVSPLWKATVGNKANEFLGSVRGYFNKEPLVMPPAVEEALNTTGIKAEPEIRAGMSGDAKAQDMFNAARNEPKIAEGIENLHRQAADTQMKATDLNPVDVDNYSVAKQGRDALNTFEQEQRKLYEPSRQAYEDIEKPFSEAKLPETKIEMSQDPNINPYAPPNEAQMIKTPGTVDQLTDKLATMAQDKGWTNPELPQANLISKTIRLLQDSKTVKDLKNLYQNINGLVGENPTLYGPAGEIKKLILNSQMDALQQVIQEKAPDLMNRFAEARQNYANYAELSNRMAQKLGVGKFAGTESLLDKVDLKRTPEQFLDRLSPHGDAELIPFLAKHYPETLEKIRQNEMYKLVKPAVDKAPEGRALHSATLAKRIGNLQPEEKQFLFHPEALKQIQAAQTLIDALPKPKTGGTPGWVNSLLRQGITSSMGMVGGLMHGLPGLGVGSVLGKLGDYLGSALPSAHRMAMLKFMGSEAPVEAGGLKAAADYMSAALKGNKMLQKGAAAVFKATEGETTEHSFFPSEKETAKLDKTLQSLQNDPSSLMNTASDLGHYMPEHTQAVSALSANAVNYLNAQRPGLRQMGPLDTPIQPSTLEKAQWNRTLQNAQQPLVVLDRLKNGTLTPKDVADIHAVSPALYTKMSQVLTNEAIKAKSAGVTIPYHVKMGLSLFAGQPMDSTLQPASIMAAQPQPAMQQPMPQGGSPGQRQKRNVSGLQKMSQDAQTRTQRAASGSK